MILQFKKIQLQQQLQNLQLQQRLQKLYTPQQLQKVQVLLSIQVFHNTSLHKFLSELTRRLTLTYQKYDKICISIVNVSVSTARISTTSTNISEITPTLTTSGILEVNTTASSELNATKVSKTQSYKIVAQQCLGD